MLARHGARSIAATLAPMRVYRDTVRQRTRGREGMDPIRSTYEADPDMLEIVCDFARELPARTALLETLLDSRAFAELQTLAHQLKGAGGGYGFAQITEDAARLEQALKSGAAEPEIKDRAADLCATLRAVVVPEAR